MSFTSVVKNEVSKLDVIGADSVSTLSAIVYNCDFSNNNIKVSTENASVARMIFKLFKDLYGVIPKITVRKGYNYNKNYQYILEIGHRVSFILKDIGLYGENIEIPKDYLVDDENLARSYLRGLFLITGSINDPKKSRYHLEFLVNEEGYAKYLVDLLNQRFYLNSKYIKRENRFMIYVKEAEKIGDFLRIINASNAVFYYEDIRIYRDHKNMTNRLNNCEQANVDKMIMSASSQVKDIEAILSIGGLALLDEKEQVVAEYRLKYREASLLELSQIISIETGKEITKSGVHHRMKKIEALALKIREKGK